LVAIGMKSSMRRAGRVRIVDAACAVFGMVTPKNPRQSVS